MSTQPMSTNPLTSIEYRRPDASEAELLQKFFRKTLADNFSYFPAEAHQHYSHPWEINVLTNRISAQKDLLLCAFANGKIAGMVSGSPVEGGVGTIIWLTVDPAWQSKKIGAALLDLAKKHYQAIGAHKLKLTVHDQRAVTFYLREGMVIEASHPQHWWGLDFWAMACFLDTAPSLAPHS